jgi:hypothetical protein
MDPVKLICFECKHFTPGQPGCKAFPMTDDWEGGIPDEILSGENDHSKPLKGQQNDIVFEKRPTDD